MKPRVMLVGVGGLGSAILERLALDARLGRIVAADRDRVGGEARVNLARLSAMAAGAEPEIEFASLDLDNEEATAELIRLVDPDLLLTTASPQTWWLPSLLPPGPRDRLRRCGYGVWLPVNLVLSMKVMRAARAAGTRAATLIGPYPDVANQVLARIGLTPTGGVGNVDEIVPKVRLLAGLRLGVPPSSLRVWLVAHHAIERPAFDGVSGLPWPPHFIRVEHQGHDVTSAVDASALLFEPHTLPGGPAIHALTATSAARLLSALLVGGGELLHAPGPHGLPGGYPVLVGRGTLDVSLPPGLALAEAIDINERAHRLDGIDRVEQDGTVVYTPETVATLDETMGYRCEHLAPADVEGRTRELMLRFREYARRHGVDVDARVAR